MSDRPLICVRCGATIQRNTPGSTGLPCPDLCGGCKEADDRDKGPHALEILSLGWHASATCACGDWGWTTTHAHGDTKESKRATIEAAHKRHIEEVI